jgi:hypothetical protein
MYTLKKSEGLDKKYVKENINIGQTFVAKHKIASFLSKITLLGQKAFYRAILHPFWQPKKIKYILCLRKIS